MFYVAPEIISGKYDEAADMWAIGIIAFAMLFKFLPFYQKSEGEPVIGKVFARIKKGFTNEIKSGKGAWFPKKYKVSKSCRDFVSKLLLKDIELRLTSEEALEHPWIKQIEPKDSIRIKLANPGILKSLRSNYKPKSILQKEIIKMLSESHFLHEFQTKAVIDYMHAANNTNNNKELYLEFNDLYEAIKSVEGNVNKNEIEHIFSNIDEDKDGRISLDDLLFVRIYRKLTSKEVRLKRIFNALDYDGNGKLTKEKIENAFIKFREAENDDNKQKEIKQIVSDIVQQTNKDGNDCIDFKNFIDEFLL